MKNLKEARKQGKLDEFIKQHEVDPKGDPEAFNRALASMAGTSKATPATSKPPRSDD